MNEDLKKLISFIDKIDEVSSIIIENIIKDNKLAQTIEDANRSQLKRGQRSDGTYLPFYSPTSVFKYKKPRTRIKLYDTGAFYKSITVLTNKNEITIISTDEKWEGDVDLKGRYGDSVLGLLKINAISIIDEFVIPKLVSELNKKIKNI